MWQTVFEQKILGITCGEISLDIQIICCCMSNHSHVLYLQIDMENSEKLSIQCNICQKKFGTKTILRQHLRYMHGEIKHRCNICDKEVRTCELNTHISINHAIAENYTCDICEKNIQYQ